MGQKLKSADGSGIKEVKTMSNEERMDRWNEIIDRLTAITITGNGLKSWILATRYIDFATEMWLSYARKVVQCK